MNQKHSTRSHLIFLLVSCLLFTTAVRAGPEVPICVEDICKKPLSVEIEDATWQGIQQLFATPFPSDKDELDSIIIAFTLLRSHIYTTLQNNNSLDDDAETLYSLVNADTHYRNAKTLLALLLDNHLVKRLYLRNTIRQSAWYEFNRNKSTGLLLQSINSADKFIFKIDTGDIRQPVEILPYKN